MPEIMVKFDDLRLYCEKRHCGSVPLEYIKQMPTIEAEPVRNGRWIPTEYDSYADGAPVWDKWECSECGHEHKGEEDTLTEFCPKCGARMDADHIADASKKVGSEANGCWMPCEMCANMGCSKRDGGADSG